MGCIVLNNLYNYETKDDKYSITIVSNILTNDLNKNQFYSKLNDSSNTNIPSQTKKINKPDIETLIKNNPFPFVKIKLKKSISFK